MDQIFLNWNNRNRKKSVATFQNIIRLRDEIEFNKLITLGKKQVDAKRLINELYKQPILNGNQVAELLGIHPSTANRLIRNFQQIGILKELTGYKRNRIYAFEEYIGLFS
ncbi:MAG: winged helix-turn-helix transcriptional regulator [Cyclobacteriaceae bacterium]